jgi:hypothetical protein
MASDRQIDANRLNAQKSNGPKTVMVTQHSQRNAIRHGLTSETIIDVEEGLADYEVLETQVKADCNRYTYSSHPEPKRPMLIGRAKTRSALNPRPVSFIVNFGRKRALIRIAAKPVVDIMIEIHTADGPIICDVFSKTPSRHKLSQMESGNITRAHEFLDYFRCARVQAFFKLPKCVRVCFAIKRAMASSPFGATIEAALLTASHISPV